MDSRTKNASRNVLSASAFQLVNIILKFALRTVFVYTLGKEYLGLNGVFSNILSILSLSELGIGSAIIYDMYKPIAEDDTDKVNSLLHFYRTIYAFIGTAIFVFGICLIPFLDYIITDVPGTVNIRLVYMLYVINSSCSYFFAQYTSLVGAYQKNYIVTNIQMLFSIVKTALEMLFLIFTRSYIVYLLVEILISVSQNFAIKHKAVEFLPFLNNNCTKLAQNEKKKIFRNAFSNFSIKISGAIINGTDNIIMSAFVSTILVGIYSNYAMIIQICQATTVMFMNAIAAGVGNICANGSVEKKNEIFKRIDFFFETLYSIIGVGFIVTIEPFVSIWIGKEYILPFSVEIVIILNCIIVGFLQPFEIYVSADGLFRHFKVSSIMAAIINIIVSIVLALKLGVLGVLLGTTISQLVTKAWFYPYIVFKYSLKSSFAKYFAECIKKIALIIVITLIDKLAIELLLTECGDVLQILFGGVFTVIIFGMIWSFFYYETPEYQYYKNMVQNIIRRQKVEK